MNDKKLVCVSCGWVQDTAAKWTLCPTCEGEHWVIVETDDSEAEG